MAAQRPVFARSVLAHAGVDQAGSPACGGSGGGGGGAMAVDQLDDAEEWTGFGQKFCSVN